MEKIAMVLFPIMILFLYLKINFSKIKSRLLVLMLVIIGTLLWSGGLFNSSFSLSLIGLCMFIAGGFIGYIYQLKEIQNKSIEKISSKGLCN